jgi:hypothetical protein
VVYRTDEKGMVREDVEYTSDVGPAITTDTKLCEFCGVYLIFFFMFFYNYFFPPK